MAGRKSLKDEIKIIDRLSALSQPTFEYLERCLTIGEQGDKRWAIEQMVKLYSKCIPTEITGEGGEALKIMIVKYGDTDSLPVDAGGTPASNNTEPSEV